MSLFSTKNKIKREAFLGKLQDEFDETIFQLNLISNRKKRKQLLKKAEFIAKKHPLLRGWPYHPKTFWDVESKFWNSRLSDKSRALIKKELSKVKGKTLSLGTGSYPYVKEAVCLDISKEMLSFIKGNYTKVQYDLDKMGSLPFKNNSFDSVTMVLVANYLSNLRNTLQNIKKVLKPNGKLYLVQSTEKLCPLHHIQEKQPAKEFNKKLLQLLKQEGFTIKHYTKKVEDTGYLFVVARK